tara:strand:+ start:4372 stop:5301 length:930 start_codon:yes stop_codon:yes gene_type:complete
VNQIKHIPVLLSEFVNVLKPLDGGIYLDATFGQGGYTKKILETSRCRVVGVDRDRESFGFAKEIKKKYTKEFLFFNKRFSQIKDISTKLGVKFDGIFFDLGLSNTQIYQSQRGFSFMLDGPLDMRMGCQKNNTITAKKIINEFSQKRLSEIFFKFGEEKKAIKISKEIIRVRQKEEICSTKQLYQIVKTVKHGYKKKNPATKVFQSLRIFINDELKELQDALEATLTILNRSGKIIVVSFHSLEDRIVKNFFKKRSGISYQNYKHLPPKKTSSNFQLKIITKKPLIACEMEVKKNSQSRSARLRAAELI